MKKRESKFSILLRHWIRANPLDSSAPVEVKQTKTNRFPFNEIKESQVDHLLAAKSDRGVFMRNQGGNGEPDYSFYRNSPAWVVIKYPVCFVVVDIERFEVERKRSRDKSLHVERARTIATHVVEL